MTEPTKPPPDGVIARWVRDLRIEIDAGGQVFESAGPEPIEAVLAIYRLAREMDVPVLLWSITGGLRVYMPRPDDDPWTGAVNAAVDSYVAGVSSTGTLSPLQLLLNLPDITIPHRVRPDDDTPAGSGPALVVLRDFYPYFGDEKVRDAFTDLIGWNRLGDGKIRRPIVFVQQPYRCLELRGVEAVRHWIKALPFPLPDADEIEAVRVPELLDQCAELDPAGWAEPGPDVRRALAESCLGLERHRIADALFTALVHNEHRIDMQLIAAVRRTAAGHLAAGRTLELVPPAEIIPPEELAGVGGAIKALERAAITFKPDARALGLDPAKGHWYCGVEGTGKSTLVNTASVVFERATKRPWPVINVLLGGFYGSLVGETEQAWYDFERRAAAIGDAIYRFDEMGEAFGRVGQGNDGSSTRQSLFGLMLSWLAHPKRPGFVIMTMNDPTVLPAQLLRAGRVDEGFRFDLPTPETRVAILQIHLAKRLRRIGLGLDAAGISGDEWAHLGDLTNGWMPGELEELIKQAQRDALADRATPVPRLGELLAVERRMRTAVENRGPERRALAQASRLARPVTDDGTIASPVSLQKPHVDIAARSIANRPPSPN